MRSSSLLFAAALVGLLLPLPLGLHPAHADGASNRPDIMPVSDIHPGMKGYGLTVFQGTKPERFDVEVIDVLKNFRPKQDLILVKTKHPRLEITKVVAGMSGSPIYLNDKMIGAYAYGWSFGSEPVAGVTPIRNMLDELARPLPDRIDGWPLRLMPVAGKPAAAPERRASNDGGRRYQGELGHYDLREHAAQLARAVGLDNSRVVSALTPVSTPILMGGMSSRSIAFAQQLMAPLGLEPLQAGGGASTEASAPTRYVDGGAVGVELVRGDMSAMGLGTVTRVEGDKLVAFGHPMSELGVTALPTAIGRVLWFFGQRSTLVQDRHGGARRGRVGQRSPIGDRGFAQRQGAGDPDQDEHPWGAGLSQRPLELRSRARQIHDPVLCLGGARQRAAGGRQRAPRRELDRDQQAEDQGLSRDHPARLRGRHGRHAGGRRVRALEPGARHRHRAEQPLAAGDRRIGIDGRRSPLCPGTSCACAAPTSWSPRSTLARPRGFV